MRASSQLFLLDDGFYLKPSRNFSSKPDNSTESSSNQNKDDSTSETTKKKSKFKNRAPLLIEGMKALWAKRQRRIDLQARATRIREEKGLSPQQVSQIYIYIYIYITA